MKNQIANALCFFVCLFVGGFLSSPGLGQEDQILPGEFVRDIEPLFDRHCLECHGPEKQEGDFRIDDYVALFDEDDGYVVAGDSKESMLYEMLTSTDPDFQMPPPDEPKMRQGEVALVKIWIDDGANIPDKTEDTTSTEKPVADVDTFWMGLWKSVGDFHPAMVHFPVALLIVGALFALISFRGSYTCADCAYYCLWIAAISGVVASATGWSYAWIEGHNGDLYDIDEKIFWHRWTGVACTALSLLLALYTMYSRYRDPDDGKLWRIGMLILAGLVSYVGHEGGELTHRRGYRMFYEFIGISGEKKAASEKDDADKKGVDETSGENGQVEEQSNGQKDPNETLPVEKN